MPAFIFIMNEIVLIFLSASFCRVYEIVFYFILLKFILLFDLIVVRAICA